MLLRTEEECYKMLMRNVEIGAEQCTCNAWHIPDKRRILKCTVCGSEHDPRYNTAFDRTNTDLAIWFYAIDRWNEDITYTAYKLAQETGITQITAGRIMAVVKSYIWHHTDYYPLGRCEMVVKRERRMRPLADREFKRRPRTYRKREVA